MADDDDQPEELGIRLDWPEDPLEVALPTPVDERGIALGADEPEDSADDAEFRAESGAPSMATPEPLAASGEVTPPPYVPQPVAEPQPPVDLTPLMARLDALIDTSMAFQRTLGERLTDYASQVTRMSTAAVSDLGEFRVAQESLRTGLRADIEEYRRTQDAALAEIRSGVEEVGAAMRRLVATTLDISSELGSLVAATRQASTQMGSLVSDVEAVVRRVDTDLHRTISENEAQQSSQRREMAALREELSVVHEELKGVRRRLPVAARTRGGEKTEEPEPDAAIAEAREARAARDITALPSDEPRPRRRRA
ncbi:MAG: hypothetical protein JOZ37_07980 [Actinobacteria bacterium]|nr:hypothetical protein [Actinomycetota bacterium]MBV8957147.1 hypothetical protein [Actinomycetota bacterium]MBV9253876.1 hypothetical protein [Actinomycetota bacterium]MBV9663889.1 hypothetical protein [Actinomycetota bacterium]MBV9933823.1 hypothetical protein [Actinomycetota bacterium]